MSEAKDPFTLSFITQYINELVRTSPKNRMPLVGLSAIFSEALVGIADGDDPLFEQYKTIIGTYHLTPREVLEYKAERTGRTVDKDISVICWALPFTKEVKSSNAEREMTPSLKWAYGTRFGEQFNHQVRKNVEQLFEDRGILAAAPVLTGNWRRIENLPGGHTSNWSERHALFAAGLGTFSLNDGFITEKGIAMRCGTVIVNANLPKTARTAKTHLDNCLFFTSGTCGKCMDRCPAYAITAEGHNKVVCRKYREVLFDGILHEQCGVEIEAGECGLCQTGVPCESINPTRG